MQKQVTAHAKKKTAKSKSVKKHSKPSHHAEIHKVANGFKTMTHFEPDMDENGQPGAYLPPEENVFSGPKAHQQAFDHVSGAMGMPQAEPDGDEGPDFDEAA